MLLSLEQILPLLRCPKTGNNLKLSGDILTLEKQSYEDTLSRHFDPSYRVIHGLPVLIDFSNSIVDEAAIFHSPVVRPSYGRLSKHIRKLVAHPQKTTRDNIKYFVRLLKEITNKPKVLIIGGASIGAETQCLYSDPDIHVVAFDIFASDYIQFIADAHSIPLPDSYFDGVLIQAVLEHVLDPVRVVSEIHRVLGKDRCVYSETPFLQHVHEAGYDFTRFTEIGHRYLFKDFAVIKSGALSGAGTQLLWSLDFFFRGLFRSRNVGKLFKLLFFWLKYFDSLIPEPYSIDAACGIFFLGRKSDVSISCKSIIDCYKGAQ